jgi:Kef-type K+ transport system membrane component KefB
MRLASAEEPRRTGEVTSPFELSVHFFLQLVCVLCACRAVSWIALRFGQPPVVGEMIAGVLLGPSLFGVLAPHWQAWLFPPTSRPILFSAAQIGLTLYMFVVGLEFRVDLVRTRLRSAIAISVSGILAPFFLGCALALWLWHSGGFFQPRVTLLQAVPYLGASMAITAFPMLARIIVERKLTNTTAGALALAAGAIDDAAAWCVLAMVLAGLAGKPILAALAVGGGIGFVILLFTVGRWLLQRLVRSGERDPDSSRQATGWILVLLMLCAWFTDTIGLYAVFGAFFLGIALPRGKFCEQLIALIEPLTSLLLLPMFFIYSGLNTRLDLVSGATAWLAALAVLAAAIIGKTGACYVSARAFGETHREAIGVGMLMNARGLMELIILNIGLERGLITPVLFSIMVLMAVLTTLMSTPLFNLTYGRPDLISDSVARPSMIV